MHLPEFVLFLLGTVVAVAAGLAVVASNFETSRRLFWTSGLSFWSLGILWSYSADNSLSIKIIVSAVIGAVAAASLTYCLAEFGGREAKAEPPKIPDQAQQVPQQSSQGKNSPPISAGGNVNIGHVGDIINPTQSEDELKKNEGVLKPGNSPMPKIPQSCLVPNNALAVFIGSNVAWSTHFPHTVLEMGDERMLVVDKDGDQNLRVTLLRIFDDRDDIIARIDEDGFWVQNTIRKKRPDPSTLIVYDHNDIEVLKLQYLNPRSISIEGTFRHAKIKPAYLIVTSSEVVHMPDHSTVSQSCFGEMAADISLGSNSFSLGRSR